MSTEEIKVTEGTVEAIQGKQAKQSVAPKKQEKITGILLRNVKYNGEIKKVGESLELSSAEELEQLVKQGILSKLLRQGDERMLELMKMLMGVSEYSKDALFKHYIDKALLIINGYLNLSNLPSKYDVLVVDYAIYLYRNRETEGYQSVAQGARSVSFEQGIPESIKAALPKPRVKVGGSDVL